MKYIGLLFLFLSSVVFGSYLSQEDIDTFYKQGYFVKKAGLSPSEISELDKKSYNLVTRALEEIQSDKYPYQDQEQKIYVDGTQIVFNKISQDKVSITRMCGCESIEPSFQKILSSKKMKETYFKLLNTDKIEQIVSQFHPKKPGDGVTFIKHTDNIYRKKFDPKWEDIGGNGSYAVCIIAIDPMSIENGGLIIDTKSYPIGNSQESEIVALSIDPGDMLFMHPDILHWSEANNSKIFRRALLSGFCIFGANHKNYPGDCTNDVSIQFGDKIHTYPAPWKKLGDTNF